MQSSCSYLLGHQTEQESVLESDAVQEKILNAVFHKWNWRSQKVLQDGAHETKKQEILKKDLL